MEGWTSAEAFEPGSVQIEEYEPIYVISAATITPYVVTMDR